MQKLFCNLRAFIWEFYTCQKHKTVWIENFIFIKYIYCTYINNNVPLYHSNWNKRKSIGNFQWITAKSRVTINCCIKARNTKWYSYYNLYLTLQIHICDKVNIIDKMKFIINSVVCVECALKYISISGQITYLPNKNGTHIIVDLYIRQEQKHW